jgi:hypothetical protein
MTLRLVFTAAICLALLAPAAAEDLSKLAPADEYFGRFQVSVLGIANAIRDAETKLDRGTEPDAVIAGSLDVASDAIVAWEQAYPQDPWIAKDLLALETAYLKIPTPAGHDLAVKTLAWLAKDYGETQYAALGRDALAPAPVHAIAVAAAAAVPAAPRAMTAWERFAALRGTLAR